MPPAFPYKLQQLLEAVENDKELSAIISWLPRGTSFQIHSYEEFEKKLLKQYFPRQTQIKSFKRQLQYYDFENYGDGLFGHPCFRKGHRRLCGQILHQLPTKSQKAIGGCGTTRPLKIRGRKKKSRASSFTSTTSSSSGSLKMRILKAAAEDASVASTGSDLSIADTPEGGELNQYPPSPKSCLKEEVTMVYIPASVGKEKQPGPGSSSIVSAQVGYTMPPLRMLPVVPTTTMMLSPHDQYLLQHQQQTVNQFRQMQAVELTRQIKYLRCLQQEKDLLGGSILPTVHSRVASSGSSSPNFSCEV
mmetsp:Transcript_26801/g.65162  ORF Transcript_26801/g.65162 Transcript_26801/m.65162 type:complete len:304 (-) Transcript_26801:102-1013(-)